MARTQITQPVTTVQKWEYFSIYSYFGKDKWVFKLHGKEHPLNELEETLCKIGQDGWELVAITDTISGDSLTGASSTSSKNYWFKRPIIE